MTEIQRAGIRLRVLFVACFHSFVACSVYVVEPRSVISSIEHANEIGHRVAKYSWVSFVVVDELKNMRIHPTLASDRELGGPCIECIFPVA